MARRKLKSAARGRSGVEGKKRETVVVSVPRLKTNEENGGGENLGSSTAARTQTDRRTSPRIHSQIALGEDLKSPPEDIVPVHSGRQLAVHQNDTTEMALKKGVDVLLLELWPIEGDHHCFIVGSL